MEQTELEKFARYFHQDFSVLHGDAEEGVLSYMQTLSAERKENLFGEISNFLNQHPGKDHKSKKNAWLKLGAQWWNKEQIVPILERLAN